MLNWIKQNKIILAFVAAIILFEFFRNSFLGINFLSRGGSKVSNSFAGVPPIAPSYGSTRIMDSGELGMSSEYTPQAKVTDRLVIQESNLSLLVKDVVNVRNQILTFADSQGGYMVSSSTSNPQDAPTATLSVRIPASKLNESLDYFHKLSIKVVSENLLGKDVTDQYLDIDTRILQIQNTMTRLEAILKEATTVTDITNLTNQILSYQNQIDALKGQKLSLQKNAELAKLTIYLSTDEIALPYAPNETFRPAVIFKLAVRSLVSSLRGLASNVIWIAVYSVVWLPVILILVLIKKWYKNRSTPVNK
jgi:hypothetical protein